MSRQPYFRDDERRMIAGVSAGLARMLGTGVHPGLVRAAFVASFFVCSVGSPGAYGVLAALAPTRQSARIAHQWRGESLTVEWTGSLAPFRVGWGTWLATVLLGIAPILGLVGAVGFGATLPPASEAFSSFCMTLTATYVYLGPALVALGLTHRGWSLTVTPDRLQLTGPFLRQDLGHEAIDRVEVEENGITLRLVDGQTRRLPPVIDPEVRELLAIQLDQVSRQQRAHQAELADASSERAALDALRSASNATTERPVSYDDR